jgi:uncharacterized protein (DUF1800 family)
MSTIPPDSVAAAIATNRFGLGARPGELDAAARNPAAWLLRQIEGKPPELRGAGLVPGSDTLNQAIELRRERAEERRQRKDEREDDRTVEADQIAVALKLPAIYRPVYVAEAAARFAHAVTTDRPFLERLTQFWSNHFAVSIDKLAVLGLAGAMEREAIRPHVTGSFTKLLLAVEKHPAMLLYLDNHLSVGPNSRAAKFVGRRKGAGARKLGINENLAREILELHTLGVEGGYSQADVTTLAAAISGWSIGGQIGRLRFDGGRSGEFHFREMFHEPGAKRVLGKTHGDGGLAQGEAILRDLAAAPATARRLATKLARHFIADAPPPAAVARIERAWLASQGDLPSVYRALVDSPEAWERAPGKFKTPADYIHSTYRALELPVPAGRKSLAAFEALGQRNLSPGSPAGWPDTSADWDGPSALLKRIGWADGLAQRLGAARNARELAPRVLGASLNVATATAIARAESGAQALTLLLVSPEFMRR